MFCLVDGTSFYSSCEQIFNPAFRRKPLLVASNNDGVIVALSREAKQLGFKKFTPLFELQHEIRRHQVIVLSSNYELYGAISSRMHDQLSDLLQEGDRQFRYSIDESFLEFNAGDLSNRDWFEFGRHIRRSLWSELRVPTGVGSGITMTLAKAANHAAKRIDGYRGVCHINESNRESILARMAASDVWGIGPRISARLALYGVRSALDLSKQDPEEMRRIFNINVANTVKELRAEPRLNFSDARPNKLQIFSTRAFGGAVNYGELKAQVIRHAMTVTTKARRQGSRIKQLLIFGTSKRFQGLNKSTIITFSTATDCYNTVAGAVSNNFNAIYSPQMEYAKCGAGALQLESAAFAQADLFAPSENPGVSQVMDSINQRFGSAVMLGAAMLITGQGQMKRANLSPSYLTCWHQLPVISCE